MIDLTHEHAIIDSLLRPFKDLKVSEELVEKIHNTLSNAKNQGKIRATYQIIKRSSRLKNEYDYIEILIESKV